MDKKEIDTPRDLAKAAADRLAIAAHKRLRHGHNDTCGAVISDHERYECSCGHDDLDKALMVFDDPAREGQDG